MADNTTAVQNRQPQGNVPAPVNITKLMSNANVKNRFEEILGKKAPGFISSVLSVAKSPALIGADPNTVLSAAVVAATLDLPINPNLGFAYIVAYKDKTNGLQAQFQMGYKGFIQLAQRSGQFKTINAIDVREGEIVREDMLSGEIEFRKLPADQREKAKVIGYAGYFRLLNGFEKTLYMTREEIEQHGKSYSQTYRRGFGLWTTNFDSMARKTVIKLLLSRFGPLSIESPLSREMQIVNKFDQAVVSNIDTENPDIEDAEPIYVDNNNEQAEQPAPEQPAAADNAARAAAVEAAAAQFANKKDDKKDEKKAPF